MKNIFKRKCNELINNSFFFSLQNQLIRTASTPATIDNDDDDEKNVVMRKKRETDEVQLRRDGALNQFISELSSNIHGRRYSEAPQSNTNVEERKEEHQNVSNENNDDATKLENSNDKIISSDSTSVGESERRKSSDLLAQPSHFVTVIEVKEASKTPETTATASTTTTTTSSSSSFKSIRSGYENVIIENNKRNSNLINEMDRSSNTSSFNSSRPSAPPIALIQDAKKKIPPR